jgi:hypothetical protein
MATRPIKQHGHGGQCLTVRVCMTLPPAPHTDFLTMNPSLEAKMRVKSKYPSVFVSHGHGRYCPAGQTRDPVRFTRVAGRDRTLRRCCLTRLGDTHALRDATNSSPPVATYVSGGELWQFIDHREMVPINSIPPNKNGMWGKRLPPYSGPVSPLAYTHLFVHIGVETRFFTRSYPPSPIRPQRRAWWVFIEIRVVVTTFQS